MNIMETKMVNNSLVIVDINDNVLHIEESNNRKRDDLNFTLLWHLRLGHFDEN